MVGRKRKRTLGLKQLKSGKWKASIDVDIDGETKELDQTFDTPGEATNWMTYWQGLGGRSSGFGCALKKALAIKAERSNAGAYRRTMDSHIDKNLIKFFGPDAQITTIDQTAIDAYCMARSAGGAGRSIYDELVHLRSAIRHARGNIIWETPKHLITVKEPNLYMPTDKEFRDVWVNCNQDMRDIITIIIFCGLRPTEAFRISPSMVNKEEGTIDIPAKIRKIKRDNRIPITKTLQEMIDRRGFKMPLYKQSSVMREEKKRLEKLGINVHGWRPYRRVLVSWAEDAGFTLDQIALVTGHKRHSMTARYSDAVGKLGVKREVLEAVEERLNLVIGG